MKLLFIGHVFGHYRAAPQERLGERHDLAFVGSVSDAGVTEPVETARCRPLGLRVIGLNRRGLAPRDSGFDEVCPWASLDETLPRADFLVVAVPLTDETRGAIDARRLDLMKRDAYLIAVSRGPVIMTPHASGMTDATFDRRIDDIADNIERLEQGEPLRNVVAVGERREA
jgi:phosphoglycerate dehydrogenase-like enzyme